MRTLRIEKSDTQRISEARTKYIFMYEDVSAVYFNIEEENAEQVANAAGGLLDMHE